MFNSMSSNKNLLHLEETKSKDVSLYPVTWWTGWWMKPRDWQWTVPPRCVQEQVEEDGWRPLQTSSSACSTPSLPATSQVSHGTLFCSYGKKMNKQHSIKDFSDLLMSCHFTPSINTFLMPVSYCFHSFNVNWVSRLLAALSNSVATVCSPAEVSCLDSYSFPPLDGLHRGPLNHDESLGFPSNGADPDCLNMLDAGFYHSELGQLGGVCINKDCERPSKRLKMALPDSFINDVSVSNLGVDFDARRTATHHHRITGAKMAVSVTDFGSLAGTGETNGFLGAHARHHTQHTAALQSEWSSSSSSLDLPFWSPLSGLYIRLTSLENPICLNSIIYIYIYTFLFSFFV